MLFRSASGTTTLSKLADVASGNALISGGVGVAPSYGKIGLTTHVSGTLPTANGGTNLTSFTANGVVYASSTSALATGSSFVFDGTNLGVGLAGYSTAGKVDSVSNAYAAFVARSSTSGTGQTVDALKAIDSTASYFANAKYSANTHIWNYGGSTTEAMRIDTSGRLGIGTTSPNALLEVKNATAGSEVARFEGNYSASGTVVLTNWRRSGGAIASAVRYNDASTMEFGTTTSHAQAFITGGTEQMRLDTSGNLILGATGASGKFTSISNGNYYAGYFQSNSSTAGYHGTYIESQNGYGVYGKTYNSSYGGVLGYNHNNTAFGILGYSTYGLYSNTSINVAGTIYTSDARLKENVVPISNALSVVGQLNPVSFDWKENSARGPSKDYGLIAQEVEQVVPDCVFETQTPARPSEITTPLTLEEELGSYKGVDYSRFIPFLIAAVKELKADLDATKAELAALKATQQ